MTARWSVPSNPETAPGNDAVPLAVLIRRAYGLPDRDSAAAFAEPSQPVRTRRTGLLRLALIAVAVAFVPVPVAVGWQWLPGSPVVLVQASEQSAPEAPEAGQRFGAGSPSIEDVSMEQALDLFLANDFGEGATPFVERMIPCGALPWDDQPALPCAPGEPPGTRHSLVLSACQPQWMTPEAANVELRSLFSDSKGSATRVRRGDDYSAVITWAGVPERSLVLALSSEGVTSFRANCDMPDAAVARR